MTKVLFPMAGGIMILLTGCAVEPLAPLPPTSPASPNAQESLTIRPRQLSSDKATRTTSTLLESSGTSSGSTTGETMNMGGGHAGH